MKIILFCLFVLFVANMSSAQGDTVQNRMHFSLLNDSTEFQYEIGQITLKSSGNPLYIDFVDSTSSVADYFLKTKPFHKIATGDSIYFRRFAHFDDKFAPIKSGQWVDITSDEQLDSIADAMHDHYENKEVYPNSAFFDYNSSIKYIVEIRKSSDNSLLKALDSITIFRSDTGFLRWKVGCRELNIHKEKLGEIIPLDTQVYIAVRRATVLPNGATLQDKGMGAYYQEPINERSMSLFQYQAFDPCNIAKQAPSFRFESTQLSDFSVVNLNIRNVVTSGTVEAHIFTSNEGVGLIRIINVQGQSVYEQLHSLEKGINTLSISIESQPSGFYTLLVRGAQKTFSSKFIITK